MNHRELNERNSPSHVSDGPTYASHNMAERWNTSPIVVFGGAMCTVVAAAIWYGGGQAVFIINWIMGLGFKIVVSTLENFFFSNFVRFCSGFDIIPDKEK